MDIFCTVEYCGGLGNQLFQIFTLLSYCIDNKKTPVLRYSEYSPSVTQRQTYWKTLFKEFKNFGEIREGSLIRELLSFIYSELPRLEGNVVLNGYFQSYKYFFHNMNQILDTLKIHSQIEETRVKFSTSYLNKEENQTIVSVHFRLGDYKNLQHCHPLLTPSYYKNAIGELKRRGLEKIKVLYFCEAEDIELVQREYLPNIEVDKIERMGDDVCDVEQMLMMSCCDWNVIANSTFSWWGAILAGHKNIIYPNKWFHTDTPKDLIPEGWISININ